jgi:Na+/H+ antiporter NhaD/arsenite permease-like protein
MKTREDVPRTRWFLNRPYCGRSGVSKGPARTPISRRPFVRLLAGLPWRIILLALGLVVQVGLLWLAGEILDLYVSAVELWAELARKHLELTLS